MTDPQPAFPPPAGRFEQQPTSIVRRHWDGNGWTQPTPTSAATPASQQRQSTDPRLGRSAG